MAGTVVIDTIKSSTTLPPTVQNTSGTEIGKFARAWVSWNSAGTIQASFNVSSVTKNGTGDFTANFSTAMADALFTVNSSAYSEVTTGTYVPSNGARTTSSVRIATKGVNEGYYDPTYACISVFR